MLQVRNILAVYESEYTFINLQHGAIKEIKRANNKIITRKVNCNSSEDIVHIEHFTRVPRYSSVNFSMGKCEHVLSLFFGGWIERE